MTGKASGQEPSPRFGHSCSYHDSSDSLIFVGGSNGTDLIRNGEDLEEVGADECDISIKPTELSCIRRSTFFR